VYDRMRIVEFLQVEAIPVLYSLTVRYPRMMMEFLKIALCELFDSCKME